MVGGMWDGEGGFMQNKFSLGDQCELEFSFPQIQNAMQFVYYIVHIYSALSGEGQNRTRRYLNFHGSGHWTI